VLSSAAPEPPGSPGPYPRCAQPFVIGGVRLRNRIVCSAHATGFAVGGIGERLVAYHQARARGGAGLIVLEAAAVSPSVASAFVIRGEPDLPGWALIANACQVVGARVFQQLFHPGSLRAMRDGSPGWSPSGVSAPDGRVPLAMSAGMADQLVADFARAARLCSEAGLDGVELQLGHGFLLGQFLSPATNLRTDDLGGDFDRRMRLPERVVQAVRAAVPPSFVVGVRLSISDAVPGGLGPADCARIAARLDANPAVDLISFSAGSYYRPDIIAGGMHLPPGYQLEHVEPVSRSMVTPTVVGGRIGSLSQAEVLLARGAADLVSVVRGQIADPELVVKSLAGRSREVRPCVYCNQGCIGGRLNEGTMACTVNPSAGRENRSPEPLTSAPEALRNVVVIGGGPAGMEAARTAALQGHHVTLFEADPQLGGLLAAARQAPHRAPLGLIVDYLADELVRLGVDVRTSMAVDTARLGGLAADVVVLAVGARVRPGIVQRLRPAASVDVALGRVVTPEAALTTSFDAGASVLVFDDLGDGVAATVAEYLLAAGHPVTHVSSHPEPAPLYHETLQGEALLRRLYRQEGYSFIGRSVLDALTATTATVCLADRAETRQLDADVVVACIARRPWEPPAGAAGGPRTVVVGDALRPGSLDLAIAGARAAVIAL
jgi:2,4-dienoyl-CoA reductase-like NADH-dependent reductase (Old Yellow Enzyme family)